MFLKVEQAVNQTNDPLEKNCLTALYSAQKMPLEIFLFGQRTDIFWEIVPRCQ